MPLELIKEDKDKQSQLSDEIENLTREADEQLGEVVRLRKTCPAMIAALKEKRYREMFSRLCEADLVSVSSRERIDVEKLKNTINLNYDKARTGTLKFDSVKAEIEKTEAELAKTEQQTKFLLGLLEHELYAPIDALPSGY